MKVFILTEGGEKIGLGHINRCLSFCQAFEERKITPTFIVNNVGSVSSILKDKDYELLNWQKNTKMLFKIIENGDLVIIDSYLTQSHLYKKIANKVKKVVCIDDNMRINYPEGTIVNGLIYAKELDYPDNDDTSYLLGTEYQPLRQDFWDIPQKSLNNEVKSILITLGGEDLRNLAIPILEGLQEDFPDIKKYITIGQNFTNSEQIKDLVDNNTKLIFAPDAQKMLKAMLEADIAISSGGQTLYELARVGVPTMAISVIDNQEHNVLALEEKEAILNLGHYNDSQLINTIYNGVQYFLNKETRQKYSDTGKSIIDGNGSRRVIDYLLE
jgi:UDP-2,4-diacetamido-2,4,6-trideoxy-beta-L-altropyranose hydrolase